MGRKMLEYYRPTILLLSAVGLWPYQREKLRLLQNVVVSFSITILVIAQLTPFANGKATKQDILKNVSFLIISSGVLTKYVIFWHQTEIIRELLEGINRDWKTADDEELKIIKEHAYMGKRYSKIFAVFIYLSTFDAMALHFSSTFLDIVLPLNETRLYKPPIVTEYFIDEQKYYFQIATYQGLAILIGGTVHVATESLTSMWLMHGACLYRLLSYHINVAVLDSINDSYVSETAYNRNRSNGITRAVLTHHRVNTFLKDLKSAFTLVYSIILILGVTSLSTNLFCLSQSTLEGDTIEDTLISMMFVISEMGYMFYINYIMQQLFDSGDDVLTAIYNTQWYKTSVSTQKSLLFIMLKIVQSANIKILLAFNPSIEGFSQLLRTSISYFTVMSSAQ